MNHTPIKTMSDGEIYQVGPDFYLSVWGYSTGSDGGQHCRYDTEACIYRWTGEATSDLPGANHPDWQPVYGFDFDDDWDVYANQVDEYLTDVIVKKTAASIRAARIAADMTQAQLAARIGTTQTMIYRYESGEQEPTVSRLIEIAKALNVSPSELLEDNKMNEITLTVNGAWNVQALPNHYVVELADGKFAKFYITPFRLITDRDLSVYVGQDPRKVGDPMPDYLYRFYGLLMTALVPAIVTIWEDAGDRYMSDDHDTVELAEDISADQVYWSPTNGYVHADGTPIRTR